MDSIWEDLERCLNEEIKEDKYQSCNHHNRHLCDSEEICMDCGEVLCKAFNACEWNSYKNDDGSYQNSTQRGDAYTSDNPYCKSATVPGFNKKSLIMRLHYQQTFSHKQKTFWRTSESFSDYCTILGLPSAVLMEAKNMWHICMESGKLTRASVRSGLIGSCLYYACVHNNNPIDRQKIIEHVHGTNKGFLKGEKIFMEIMNESKKYVNIGKKTIDIKENNSFIMFCTILELPFRVCVDCDDIYEKNRDKLDSVTPKSAIAGILFYTIKNILGLKKPSKNKVSEVVKVCIPTMNKVLAILEKD